MFIKITRRKDHFPDTFKDAAIRISGPITLTERLHHRTAPGVVLVVQYKRPGHTPGQKWKQAFPSTRKMSGNHEANPDANISDKRKSNGQLSSQLFKFCFATGLNIFPRLVQSWKSTAPFPRPCDLDRGDGNLLGRCAVVLLHQVVRGVIVHGDVGTGKPERVDRL